jgi:hypothetical protein
VVQNIDNNGEKVDIYLLLDSLTSHWNQDFPTSDENNLVEIHKEKIAEGLTPKVEPLHTYFNCQLKYFVKTFTKRVRIDFVDIDVKNRLTAIKLFSLFWNQLCSLKFQNMILYACKSSGLIESDFSLKSVNLSANLFPE